MGLTPEDFEAAALALPGAVLHVGPNRDRTYIVQGIAFAVRIDHVSMGKVSGWGYSPSVVLRCNEAMFARLIKHDGISEPLRRMFPEERKWVMLKNLRVMPAAALKDVLAEAHAAALEECA